MLYVPCTTKPRYGDAGIIPGHLLTPDFALLANECGGKTVCDIISKRKYNLDATYQPSWHAEGLEFDAEKKHINGPSLNDVIEAGGSGTIFFQWKYTNTPTSLFCFFYTPSDAFFLTSLNDTTSFGFRFWVGGSYGTKIIDFTGVKSVAITWISSGGSTTWNLYLDGIDMGAGNTIAAEVPTNSNTFDIGGEGDAGGRWSGGIIDDFYIYKHVLSCAEIAQLSAKPNCWLYSRSEQLIRSVWAVSGGGTVYNRTIYDTVGITDSLGRSAGYSRSISDTVGLTDALNRIAAHVRTKLETIGVTDSLSRTHNASRTIADTVGLTDALSSVKAIMVLITDTIGLTDNLSRAAGYARTITDTISITDALSRAMSYVRTLVDTVGVTDVLSRAVSFFRQILDTIGITDILSGSSPTIDKDNAIIFPVLNLDAEKIFPVKSMPEQIEFDTRDLDETIIFPVKEE